MDSSFMATPHVELANPLDAMMSTLRAQITAEVKSGLTADILDRVIRVVGSSLSNIQPSFTATNQITVPPSSVEVNSTPALVDITNEMNMDELCASMCRIEVLLQQLIAIMKAPVQRSVTRDSENLIQSMTERRF